MKKSIWMLMLLMGMGVLTGCVPARSCTILITGKKPLPAEVCLTDSRKQEIVKLVETVGTQHGLIVKTVDYNHYTLRMEKQQRKGPFTSLSVKPEKAELEILIFEMGRLEISDLAVTVRNHLVAALEQSFGDYCAVIEDNTYSGQE